jgi:tetratricopeptide (TPR) repeat protein
LAVLCLVLSFQQLTAQVKVYEGKETIPTYQLGPNEPSPIFYTGRNVQGAAGHYYPYPAQITLGESLTDVTYDMIYLENEYLKVSILPALGGKLFSAIDKTNGHEIFHRNSTIKPDLIGTLGAWISGGIEWCYPHHHRTTTFMPADYRIETNEDGSATVWVGETEKSLHLRGVIGITLHPGHSYIDVVYRLNNPNPVMRNFKFWANVAVTADSNFRTFFPPSQEIGVFHNNSSFTHWPISHEVYKGTDYTSGVDMTWYKNHPSPVSVFFWEGKEGFIGGYDYAQKAGVVHVGDKYVNRTSKLWEWGPSLEGENARRKLTDDGRDYVELMTGSFSNNQPDYSWFAPHTVKEAQNFWYPLRDIEIAKNATLDAAVTLQMRDPKTVFYGFNTTGLFRNAKVVLKYDKKPVVTKTIDIDPATSFTSTWISKTDIDEFKLDICLMDEKGKILVSYTPYKMKNPELPEVFEQVKPPREIESVEDLYLTGRFVEQFSRPFHNADDYYLEALKKSPDDYRVNLAMGIRRINQWRYAEAEEFLQKAAVKLKTQYIQPLEGELFYYLGLAQRAQGKDDDAYRNFNRGTFYYQWFSQGNFQLAQMESNNGNYSKALEYIINAYSTNHNDGGIILLYSALLRKQNKTNEALALIDKLIQYDPISFAAVYEKDLLQGTSTLDGLHKNMQDVENNYLEIVVNYMNAGMYDDAVRLLTLLRNPKNPLTHYYLSYLYGKLGQQEQAVRYAESARSLSFDYCFPFRPETEKVLQYVISVDPDSPYPYYLLGNLLYDYRPAEAIEAWNKASNSGENLSMVWRNLAFGAFHYQKKPETAIVFLKKAIDKDANHPMWYAELEKYYDDAGKSPEECVALLEEHTDLVKQNVTAPQSLVKLYNIVGEYDKAIDLLETHHFRTWEGGRSIYWHYVDAHTLRALRLFKEGKSKEAIADLETALLYPANLEVGKPLNDERNAMIYCFIGQVYEKTGNKNKAEESFKKCIETNNSDDWPDLIYYQGVACQKTGDTRRAAELFKQLADIGTKKVETSNNALQTGSSDGDEDLDKKKLLSEGYYLHALSALGIGDRAVAGALLTKSLEAYKNNLWAKYFLENEIQ